MVMNSSATKTGLKWEERLDYENSFIAQFNTTFQNK